MPRRAKTSRLGDLPLMYNFIIIGAVEKKAWREGLTHPKDPKDMFPHENAVKTYYQKRQPRQQLQFRREELGRERGHSVFPDTAGFVFYGNSFANSSSR